MFNKPKIQGKKISKSTNQKKRETSIQSKQTQEIEKFKKKQEKIGNKKISKKGKSKNIKNQTCTFIVVEVRRKR